MNIPLLFVSFLVLSGGNSADNTEINELEIGDLCGSYTYQVVKPIADQLDQLNNSCGKKQKENKDLRENIQQLEIKIVELQTSELSKDIHIKELQARISEIRNSDYNLKQLADSVNEEIVQLKSFIKEEFKLSKIDPLSKNVRSNSENTLEMKSMTETLKACRFNFSELQSVVRVYQEQLGITRYTIDKKSAVISQLTKQVQSNEQTLKESQIKLTKNQYELKKQKEIIQQKEEEIFKLKEHIKKGEVKPTSCIKYGNSNSVHHVEVPYLEPFPVLCNSEIAGLGWTVIQQRINGGEDFYRNWEAYKNGFGDFTGDFFLGLEKIYRLTKNQPHELYIHMERFNGKTEYVRYNIFIIQGEEDKYRLFSLGEVTGSVEYDNMRPNEHMKFSTYDSLNEKIEYSADFYHGGWWFANNTSCNLNGKYYQEDVNYYDSNWWTKWYSLKTIKMLIRPLAD